MEELFDVIVIGGGVVGCAIARELSRYKLRIGVLEKNPDVGYETSARNTGVCHGGFAYDPGTLKARMCVEGNKEMGRLSEELDFKFRRCGKVLVGNTEEERARLLEVIRQGEMNGASGLRMIEKEELHRLVPSVLGEFALLSENSGIIDPFMMTIALAENAVHNGAEFFLQREVEAIRRDEEGNWVITARTWPFGGKVSHAERESGEQASVKAEASGGRNPVSGDQESAGQAPGTVREEFRTRWVVNSAGLSCGKISDMLGIKGYKIIYSKDDYIILDNRLGSMVPMPIYTVPSNTYMGIHVTVTTDGNVLLGPTAEDIDKPSGYGVEQKNIDYLYDAAMAIWPHVKRGDYIRTYCGILPKWVDEKGVIQDFKIEIRDDIAPRAVNLVGMESPALTGAPAIARYVVGMMLEREEFPENADFDPVRKGIPKFSELPEEEQERLIAMDADFGELVCRCQKVTKAEILAAIRNPLGAQTMVAVKYRTRAMMGRCQGGYCQMRIAEMLEQETGARPEEITYARQGSNIFYGKVREA